MRFFRPPDWTADSTNIYLSYLARIPYEHVFTAIGEWIGQFKWMPAVSEWREIAVRHWEDASRRERLRNPRLERKPSQPMTSGGLRQALRERAEAGDDWAAATLSKLERADKKRVEA